MGPLAPIHGLWYDYNLFLNSGLFIRKHLMSTNELHQQLNLKQTELNYANDTEQRKTIEKAINILRLKLEIEKIRDRIDFLNQR